MKYEELESKWWYRLLKVIYIIVYVLAVLFVIGLAYSSRPQTRTYYYLGETYTSGSWNDVFLVLFIGLIITYVAFGIIKRIFFYVSTGKWTVFKIKPSILYCSSCGAELQKNINFCVNCGKKIVP